MIDFIATIVLFPCLAGGGFFFFVLTHDVFCPIGQEWLCTDESFRKDKANLRWNRK